MELTEENKKTIDSWPYKELLRLWRFSPVGDPMFQGETAEYFVKRMSKLKNEGADHVGASKEIGWC